MRPGFNYMKGASLVVGKANTPSLSGGETEVEWRKEERGVSFFLVYVTLVLRLGVLFCFAGQRSEHPRRLN